MKRGDRGVEVVALQRRLADAGFDPGLVDGVFGVRTEEAVLGFQGRYGNLAVDGVAGPLTMAALRRLEFIRRVIPPAVDLERRHEIPAAFTAAQATHEALNGDGSLSVLADEYHNLFGVKARAGELSVQLMTWEVVDGRRIQVRAAFRVYRDWAECSEARAQLLLTAVPLVPGRPAYRDALRFKADPARYAVAIWDAGYATDPAYVAAIVRLLGDYHIEDLVAAKGE